MDYCVICGRIVPEGTHVCVNCRHAVLGTSMGTESETGVVMEEKEENNKMTDRQVVESFDNAWKALCMQYRKYPEELTRQALNMLGCIIGKVKNEVEDSHRDKQMTIDEWIKMLNGGIER